MAMFGLSKQAVNEIETALQDPNCTVDTLLKCSSLTCQFRNGNKKLLEFLQKEQNARRIFEIIHTESNRKTQRTILGLFQTSNTTLHRLLADNIPLCEFALSILEKESPLREFSFGIISRVFSRAFDLWPDDMSEVMRTSNYCYRLATKHVNNVCVFHLLQDLMTETHKGSALWLWHGFMSMIPEEGRHEYSWPKRELLIREELFMKPEELGPDHRRNIMHLMVVCFRNKIKAGRDVAESQFRAMVLKWLKKIEPSTLFYFRLAATLEPDRQIHEKAMKMLEESDLGTVIADAAVKYLTKAVQVAKVEDILKILYLLLTRDDVANLTLSAGKQLLAAALEREALAVPVAEAAKKIVAYAYTRINDDNRHLLLPFIIKFATMLKIDGARDFSPEWIEFGKKVADPWLEGEEYDETFTFSPIELDPNNLTA